MREDVKMSRCERRCERRCEDEKMFDRPQLLEEPCAQTLWGKSAPKLRCFVHFDLECASHHKGVQLFISHLLSSSLLFSSLTLPISAFHLSILSEV